MTKSNKEASPDSTPPNLKCGLVMPISGSGDYTENHWAEVRAVLKEALAGTAFTVELVSDSSDVGVIQKRIVENLYSCDLVICDVSAKNPNVMFELGMRLAFDKPAIIVKDEVTAYSFDTSPIEHLVYPRSLHYQSIVDFKKKLRDKSIATYEASKKPGYTTFLKHFGEFVVASINPTPVSKEDFILRELGDLRREVAELSFPRARVETRNAMVGRAPGGLQYRDKEAVDLVRSYIKTDSVEAKDLLDVNSDKYMKLIEVFARTLGLESHPYIEVQSRLDAAIRLALVLK